MDILCCFSVEQQQKKKQKKGKNYKANHDHKISKPLESKHPDRNHLKKRKTCYRTDNRIQPLGHTKHKLANRHACHS